MAEWKTDTEEKRLLTNAGILKKPCKKKRCGDFIKDLDSYAIRIRAERRKIEKQLEKAKRELKAAIKERKGFWGSVLDFGKGLFDVVGSAIPPFKLGAGLCEKGLNLMEDN